MEKFRISEQQLEASIRARGTVSSMVPPKSAPEKVKSSGSKDAAPVKAPDSKDPGLPKKNVQRVAYETDTFLIADGEQLIGILAALLRLNLWDTAKPLLDRLKAAGVMATSWPEVADSLAGLVSWVVDPVFADISHRKMGLAKPLSGVLPIPELRNQPARLTNVGQMFDPSSSQVLLFLNTLGHSLSCSPLLFCKICRLLVPFITSFFPELSSLSITVSEMTDSGLSADKQSFLRGVYSLMCETMLPSFTRISKTSNLFFFLFLCFFLLIFDKRPSSMTACNPAVSVDLWFLISLFPFQIRYEMYDAWKGVGFAKEALGVKDNKIVLVRFLTV